MDAQKIGMFIAAIRKEKGLTQVELANQLFVSDKTISKWERGAGFPDVRNWEPLAEALGVSIVELMQGERVTTEEIGISKTEVLLKNALQINAKANQALKILSYILSVLLAMISGYLLFLTIHIGRPVMFLSFGGFAIITALCNMICSINGKNADIFRFLSISFTALTVCTFYQMDAQFVGLKQWSSLTDVVPAMTKLCWFGTVASIMINGATFFINKQIKR